MEEHTRPCTTREAPINVEANFWNKTATLSSFFTLSTSIHVLECSQNLEAKWILCPLHQLHYKYVFETDGSAAKIDLYGRTRAGTDWILVKQLRESLGPHL